MITEVQIEAHPDEVTPERLQDTVARILKISTGRITGAEIVRKSIDARHGKVRLKITCRVAVDEPFEPTAMPTVPDLPTLTGAPRVAVIGAGPGGLWAAWQLARAGVKSVVFERGQAVRGRRKDLAVLNREGTLNTESNYCFGEGGAGTFSDGKLYTRATKRGPIREVFDLLAACGAPRRILVDARPHIGTNRLPKVIGALRDRLTEAGVEVCFDTRVDDLIFNGRRLTGVQIASGEIVPVEAAVVATGHSARDVYTMLHRHGVALEAKAFAAGVRIEHPQALIDRIQYGPLGGHPMLGAAPYALKSTKDGIGVYSFCMCPGGFIVAAATEADGVVVNGMSPYSRGSRYANSGMVITVGPEDFGDGPLDGLAWQRALEQQAFVAGGGKFKAPAQRITDFLAGRASTDLPDCSYRPGLNPVDLKAALPSRVTAPLDRALRWFEKARMRGYVTQEAVMVGVESRSSAPIRILREAESLESPSHPGVFPCAEGAGYAGGIVSAALDGMKVAEGVLRSLGVAAPAPLA